MRIMVAVLAAAALALTGCDSIISGERQPILITTPPTQGAECVLLRGQEAWTVTSPATVLVEKTPRQSIDVIREKSPADIYVKCTKPGWQDAVASISPKPIAFALAAMQRHIEYPDIFQVPMEPVSLSPAAETAGVSSGPAVGRLFGSFGVGALVGAAAGAFAVDTTLVSAAPRRTASSLAHPKDKLEPFFPWPPPQPYASDVIASETFLKRGAKTLGNVGEQVSEKLRAAGYPNVSFFSIGDAGFAMVTRLERVTKSGRPFNDRWQEIEHANLALNLENFSITEYLQALFQKRAGLFRLFVFLISPTHIIPDPQSRATLEMVHQWQQAGRAVLPLPLANRTFSPDYTVQVLLYQFRKLENQSPELVSNATVKDQFRATGLRFE
ncbi:MAG TPA: hypothetical protein VHM88_08675 [Candidatus Acidoferrales bacterium]|nr:hypothetical protein [Candidatus Acidoferrales bacterium]